SLLAADGSHIDLQSATLIGGTLEGSGSGFFQALDASSILDGSNGGLVIAASAVVDIANGHSLTLKGAIHNHGTIDLASVSSFSPTSLLIDAGGVTLDGGGTITLEDQDWNHIKGSGKLTNVDNTIAGSGALDGGLTLVNQAGGTIDATG